MAAPTSAEAAERDRRAREEADTAESVLMENAGRSAALLLQHLHPDGPVVGVVGKGNNGGDALVLLRTLAAWGREVVAIRVADRGDDAHLLHGWGLRALADGGSEAGEALACAGVVVDGILGTGIRGAPRDRQARAIRRVNASGAPVFALDVPSGVDGTTGAVPDEAVRAHVTVSFGGPKLGTLLHPARERVGRLVAVEIGFPPPAPGEDRQLLLTPGWAAAVRPRRAPDTHKSRVGALLVLAGSRGMAGAAVLTVQAALRGGAGLVRVASDPANREILQVAVPEAIYVDASDPSALDEAVAASDAVAAGPGLGRSEAAARALARVLEAGAGLPLLLDADALNLAAEGRVPEPGEVARDRPVLLTPHPGEMERISGRDRSEILADRPGAARAYADRSGCAVLLKGIPSLIAEPSGGLLVDTTATSDLATAGMGDVLSGASASFLAQGAPPAEAGGLGLFYGGRAAGRAARGVGLLPRDVVRELPDALLEQGDGETDLPFPFVLFDQAPAR